MRGGPEQRARPSCRPGEPSRSWLGEPERYARRVSRPRERSGPPPALAENEQRCKLTHYRIADRLESPSADYV